MESNKVNPVSIVFAIMLLLLSVPVQAVLITDGVSINGVSFDEPWYEVKNVAGDATIFLIDKDGDMYLDADAIAVSSAITGPFANSLIIQDAADEIFVINATNAYFSGKIYPNFATLPTMDGDDMVIQNVAGTPVAIFDGGTNSLYLSGNATHDAVTVEPRNALEFAGATRAAGSYPAGTHEHITLPNMAIDFSSGLTFEGWFYWDAVQNWSHPVRLGDGTNYFQILHDGTNSDVRFNTVTTDGSTWLEEEGVITLNTWTHIAFTLTPTGGGNATGRMYKNGILMQTNTALYSLPNTTWTLNYLAWGSSSDGNQSFDGKLDEFRFWNDVRSQSEIQADMFTTYGTLANSGSLVAYWDFNDVLGSKLIDSHSGNFHGTLQDMNSDAWVGSYTERTLTIASAGNGTLSPTGAQIVADGQSFPIVATPSANYTFEYWAKTAGAGTVTFSDAANDTTWVTVTGGDAEITAYFDYTTWANTTTYTLNTTASYANVSTTQTDFPILVRLTAGDFTFADARGNGEDIRFTDAAGLPLSYEIERWDSTNALAEVWVKVASIAGNSTTDIKMFWGRTDVTSKSDGEAVFPLADSYEGVWHLNDITDLDDATANAGTGTNSGTVNIAGNIGQAVDYEGADWISLPAANFSDLTTQVSVSCWIYGDAAMQPQDNLLFRGIDGSGFNALAAYVPWSDQNVFWDAGNVGVLLNRLYGAVDASKWEGAWVYYTFTKDQTTGALEIFINGNSEMSGTGYTYTFSTIVTFLLGAYTVGQYNYDGIIDEFRVSSSVRSDDWIKLAYENQRAENYLINSRAGNTITLVDGGANGSIANEGPNVVPDGNPFALTATPDAGYDVWWVQTAGAGTAVFTDAHAASTSVTVTGGNATLTCYFNYTNWSNSTTWTLNTTPAGADVSGDVANFPVLIRLTASNFIFAQAQTNGEDIRFAASDESPLDYEIERWDNAGQVAEIWVKVPTITGNSTTDIKMYWGNSDAPSLSDGEEVFETSNNFAAVWHLEEEGNTNSNGYEDATANNVHGTGVSMTTSSDVDAVIGRGQDFDGAADYIDVSDISSSFANGITVCVWTQWDAINDWSRVIDFSESGEADDNIFITAYGTTTSLDGTCFSGASADGLTVSGYITTNTWMHTCYTNTSGGDAVVYKNGVVVGSESGNTAPTSVTRQSNFIAKSNWAGGFLNGKIDELSLHNAVRSADWVKLMYESERNPSTLLQTTHYETWDYNRTFTLNTTASGADVAGTVTDFPVLIRLTGSDFTFGQARTNGEDIRFTDATSSTVLDYEIERWDNAGELAEIWVKVPTIAGNSTTNIKMYWGQSDAPSLSDGEAVFETSNSFAGVWHLSEDGNTTADGYIDATTNNNDGTGVSLTAASDVEGITGIGHLLDGDADYIQVDDHATLDFTNNYTLSAWVKPDNTTNSWEGVINKDRSITSGYYLMYYNNGSEASFSNQFHDGGYQVSGTNKYYTTDEWFHVTGTYDGADLKLFVNGEEIGSNAVVSAASTNAQSLFIGGINGYADDFFDGYMDEVRVASSARSADWIKLAYENQRSEDYVINLRPVLTITAGSDGAVDNAGANSVDPFVPMSINATPDATFTFNGWTQPTNPGNVTLANSDNFTTTTTATGDGEVQANFIATPTNALEFDGADDQLIVADMNPDFSGGLTIEGWFQMQFLGPYIRLVEFSNGAHNSNFGIWNGNSDASLNYAIHNGISGADEGWHGHAATGFITTDEWIHFAVTHAASGDVTVYKNGIEVSSGTGQALPSSLNRTQNSIGWSEAFAGSHYDGYMDEIRLWNDVRTELEVQADMFNSYANLANSSNLVAHWEMNQVKGTLLEEATGNYPGTMTNMANAAWIGSFTQVALTVSTGANGTVSPSSATMVAGGSATIVATPATGYTFNGWTKPTNPGNMTITDSDNFTTMVSATGDGEVLASFTAKPEKALSFDGVDEYVDIADINEDWSSGCTFEAWVYMDATVAAAPVIFSMGNGGGATLNVGGIANNGDLRVGSNEAGYLDVYYASFFDLDAWTHLAVTIASDGATVVYKNGSQITTGTLNAVTTVNRSDVFIGYNVYGEYFYDGDIDEVRLWKDVRTASEIYYDHYNAYEDLNSTDNLVAYWDANQVSGTLLKDEVGGYTGTLTNMESGDWVTSWTRRTLTVASSANGSNNVDGAITVMDTKWFYINGTPDVGYVFTNWIDGGGGVVPVFSDAAAASSWVYISGGDGSILGSFDVDFDPGYVDNAQFNSGTTGWTNLTHSSGAQSFSVVGGEAVIAVTGTGGDGNRWNNNIMQEFSGTTEILVSTNYTVSFDIKANKASVDYHAQMYGHTSSTTSPSGALGGQSGTITTSWQTVSFTWSHGGAYNYKFLNIGFGGVDQAGLAPYTVYIDNVSIIAQ